jgi:hypothetical protein
MRKQKKHRINAGKRLRKKVRNIARGKISVGSGRTLKTNIILQTMNPGLC